MPEPPIVTTLSLSDSVWVVSLRGEHDVSTHDQLVGEIDAACGPGRLVLIDLGQADFVASSVLSDLMAAQTRSEAAGGLGFAIVVRPGTAPARLFEMTHAHGSFPLFATRADAIEWFVTRLARRGVSHDGMRNARAETASSPPQTG